MAVNDQYILVNQEKEINTSTYKKFLDFIEQIINGKPLQYITNHQEFMGYDFFVNESVLIPQPDTEIVVKNCMDICLNLLSTNKRIKLLDLCTGSGAIAISLDKRLNKYDNIEVYASDISGDALKIAKYNNKKLSANVKFSLSDMFKDLEKQYDIIVSNPPYIATNIISSLPNDVQSEPHIALDGGKDGLKFYRIIAEEGINYLTSGGYLCMEIGYDQAEKVKKILEPSYRNIRIEKDFESNDRCIIATL